MAPEREAPRESDRRPLRKNLATSPTERATALRPSRTDRAPAENWRRKGATGGREGATGVHEKGDPDSRLGNMTTEHQPGRPTTEDTELGWPTNGMAHKREGSQLGRTETGGAHDRDSPQPGRPTTGKAHRRGGTQPGRPKTGLAYNREQRRVHNGPTWPALLAWCFC